LLAPTSTSETTQQGLLARPQSLECSHERDSRTTLSPIIPLPLFLIGAVLILTALFVLEPLGLRSAPAAGAITTAGAVVATPTDSDGACSPVAEYTVDGTTYSIESVNATGPCPYAIGDELEISYHPDSPGAGHFVGDFATGVS
jgi:hypothetical protein